MSHTLVKVEIPSPGITQLTMQRSEKRNALSVALMEELIKAIEIHGVKSRALIITGEGPVFSAGLDLQERNNPKLTAVCSKTIATLFKTIMNAPCVTLAAVRGNVLAGGVGIVLSCDWAVMADSAFLSFPEVKKGIVPTLVAQLLHAQVAMRHARELLIFGKQTSAKQALAIGVVNQLASPSQVLSVAMEQATSVLESDEATIKQLKRLLNKINSLDDLI